MKRVLLRDFRNASCLFLFSMLTVPLYVLACSCPPYCCQNCVSPIIIDTTGKGFQLTSAEKGVLFDFFGDGHPIQMSWTAGSSGNAFLALDRNHNGKIDSAKELFGNITEQPPSDDPNGFLALAVFDQPENGGNGDGIIDKRDAVFSQLLLWIDENHDGISQPNELHSLPELGIYSLALRYVDTPRTDEYGNKFHYKSAINPDPKDGESRDGRWDYDVFFTIAAHPSPSLPPDADIAGLVGRGQEAAPCGPTCLAALYHQSVAVGQDGKPSLQFTNDSQAPIVAYFMVEFPSLGMEGRTYFDAFTSSRDQPIPPGVTVTKSLSSFSGRENKVRAEVRAVIFKDGSSAGDPVWVNAILARRLRFYDRLLSLYNLLTQQVGTGISRERVMAMLQAAQADADKQLPEDDLRVMDDLVFHGAISTFAANPNTKVGRVLTVYLKYLKDQAARMELSRPDLAAIRALPAAVPKPLSEASLPSDYQITAAALASKAGVKDPASQPSSCTVLGAQFDFNGTEEDACYTKGFTNNLYTSFSNDDFGYYNAATGKTTQVPWSWSPGQNDLDTAFGQCVQYEDCSQVQQIFYVQGSATGEAAANLTANTTVVQGQDSKPFYWDFDYYPDPTFSDCSSCPGGLENPVSIDAPNPGVIFYFNYACVVDP